MEVSGSTHTGVSEGLARRDSREGTPERHGRARSRERTPEGEAHGHEGKSAVPEPRSCEGGGDGAGAAGGDGGRAGRVPAPRRSPRTSPPSAAAAAIGSRAEPRQPPVPLRRQRHELLVVSTRGVWGVLSSCSAPDRRAGQGSREAAAAARPLAAAPRRPGARSVRSPLSPFVPRPPGGPGSSRPAPLRRQGAAGPPSPCREGVWRAGKRGFPFPHGFPSATRVWKQPQISSPGDRPGERRAARPGRGRWVGESGVRVKQGRAEGFL